MIFLGILVSNLPTYFKPNFILSFTSIVFAFTLNCKSFNDVTPYFSTNSDAIVLPIPITSTSSLIISFLLLCNLYFFSNSLTSGKNPLMIICSILSIVPLPNPGIPTT